MIIEALFLAQDLVAGEGNKTIVLIDVFRTSTTLVTILSRGARDIIVAGKPEDARVHRERLPSCLLCGETGGARPPDFDYGNSPGDYADLVLEGKQLVFTSSNGVRAMGRLVGERRRVLMGSYTNADAVVRAALADAESRSADIAVVASGRNHGTRYGIEDCHCAGFLIDRLITLIAGAGGWAEDSPEGTPHRLSDRWTLEDSALMALNLYRSYGLDFDRVVARSGDAQILRSMGLAKDFPPCLAVDSSQVVPEVSLSPAGYMVINPISG